MSENTNSETTAAESAMLAIIAHPNATKAMEVLVKAAACKDSFADSFAALVKDIPSIGDIVTDYDKAKAFVGFMLAYRGVNTKGKTRRESNRIAYVKVQSTVALCDAMGIEIPKGKTADWEYEAWLSKVLDTIAEHKVNVDTFVRDVTTVKA